MTDKTPAELVLENLCDRRDIKRPLQDCKHNDFKTWQEIVATLDDIIAKACNVPIRPRDPWIGDLTAEERARAISDLINRDFNRTGSIFGDISKTFVSQQDRNAFMTSIQNAVAQGQNWSNFTEIIRAAIEDAEKRVCQ